MTQKAVFARRENGLTRRVESFTETRDSSGVFNPYSVKVPDFTYSLNHSGKSLGVLAVKYAESNLSRVSLSALYWEKANASVLDHSASSFTPLLPTGSDATPAVEG